MCNAWNHNSNCRCGFGGEGHLGKNWDRLNSIGDDEFLKQIILNPYEFIKREYDSFTIPNAICPVCGAQVFFYQSPYGGRVFFDELQPPWPKHPCTDSSNSVEIINSPGNRKRRYKKFRNNWYPLTLHKSYLKIIDDYVLISGSINTGKSYEGFKEYLVKNDDDLKYSNPLFYRETSPNDFEISTFVINGKSVKEIIVDGWKREKAIIMYPQVIKLLRIKVGDAIRVLFKGEYKGIHLKVHPMEWDLRKSCLIDKIDLSASKRMMLKTNPKENFELSGVVSRTTDTEVFIREVY